MALRCIWWDPAGFFVSGITWFLICVATIITHDIILLPWFPADAGNSNSLNWQGWTLFGVYLFLVFMSIWSHLRAYFSDPCLVPLGLPCPDKLSISKFCKKCQGWKPSRAHHCSVCQRCVFRMDHHCPWINNCVGYGSQKFFMLFLFYISILSAYSLILLLTTSLLWSQSGAPINPVSVCLGSMIGVESAFFAYFVMTFITEQLESLETNTTLIETYQFSTAAVRGTFAGNFKVIFGTNVFLWFIPIDTADKPNFEEEISRSGMKSPPEQSSEQPLIELSVEDKPRQKIE